MDIYGNIELLHDFVINVIKYLDLSSIQFDGLAKKLILVWLFYHYLIKTNYY